MAEWDEIPSVFGWITPTKGFIFQDFIPSRNLVMLSYTAQEILKMWLRILRSEIIPVYQWAPNVLTSISARNRQTDMKLKIERTTCQQWEPGQISSYRATHRRKKGPWTKLCKGYSSLYSQGCEETTAPFLHREPDQCLACLWPSEGASHFWPVRL